VTGALVLGAAALSVLGAVEVLQRARLADEEVVRKLAHAGAGIVAAFAPLALGTHWELLALCAGFALLLAASRPLGLLRSLHPPERPAGDLVYPIAIYLAFVLAHEAAAYVVAVLVLALGDSAAALVGRRYGRHRYRAVGTSRSLEGSLALFAVAFAVALAPLGIVCALAVAAVAAVAEALAPPSVDNLVLPLATLPVAHACLP
jgi:phytol kinase